MGTQGQLVRAHCWKKKKKKDEKTKKKNEKFLLQREEKLNPETFFPLHLSQKTKKSWKTSIIFCVFRAKPNKSQKMVT
jgi:hypothetical protein